MQQAEDKFTLALPLPGVPKKRGRPPLPPGQAKTHAQRQREYRARKGITSIDIPADLLITSIAALQAGVECRMLKSEDRAVLAALLAKLGG